MNYVHIFKFIIMTEAGHDVCCNFVWIKAGFWYNNVSRLRDSDFLRLCEPGCLFFGS
jgi:hypothetical protein